MEFEEAFNFVISQEGGYVDNPNDPGGETKYGISKRHYPDLDIKNVTLEQAKEIYKRDYWNKASCDEMPNLLKMPVFDSAVNQGVHAAIKYLQRAVGSTEDGIWGPNTKAAVESHDPKTAVVYYLAERALVYTETVNFEHFGRGWMRRLFHVASENK